MFHRLRFCTIYSIDSFWCDSRPEIKNCKEECVFCVYLSALMLKNPSYRVICSHFVCHRGNAGFAHYYYCCLLRINLLLSFRVPRHNDFSALYHLRIASVAYRNCKQFTAGRISFSLLKEMRMRMKRQWNATSFYVFWKKKKKKRVEWGALCESQNVRTIKMHSNAQRLAVLSRQTRWQKQWERTANIHCAK